jgi:histone H3/H4
MRRDDRDGAASSSEDAQTIVDTALFSVTRGAGRARMDMSATESVREQFLRKIRPALQKADWRSDWQREKGYLRAYAEAMGRRAATLAAEDGRAVITRQDIEAAAVKMRGYMPIAGRWCPL